MYTYKMYNMTVPYFRSVYFKSINSAHHASLMFNFRQFFPFIFFVRKKVPPVPAFKFD